MKKNILNIYGLGKLKYSASLASALAVGFFFLINYVFALSYLWLNLAIYFILLAQSLRELKIQQVDGDPKEIVVDEFLGMYTALLFYDFTRPLYHLVFLFAAFRFLDIVKIPPFSWIDKMKNRSAILWDDVAIGFLVGVGYMLITMDFE